MAVRLQNKINAPGRETRRPREIDERRQDGPGSYQDEGAKDVLSCNECSLSYPSHGETAVALVEASHCTYDDELACGVALNSPEHNPWILDVEPSRTTTH